MKHSMAQSLAWYKTEHGSSSWCSPGNPDIPHGHVGQDGDINSTFATALSTWAFAPQKPTCGQQENPGDLTRCGS